MFTEGRNIGDEQVLMDIAQSVGFDANEDFNSDELVSETHRMFDATRAMGVHGVPVIIFEDKNSIAGVQTTEAILRVMDNTDPAEEV